MAKAEALRKGEFITRGTARASFKVVETKGTVAPSTESYTPSAAMFRSYKLQHGKIVPLKDTYIQRDYQRIKSRGEISEISLVGARASAMARRNKVISKGSKVSGSKTATMSGSTFLSSFGGRARKGSSILFGKKSRSNFI